jgi:hypothetical protein
MRATLLVREPGRAIAQRFLDRVALPTGGQLIDRREA